MLFKDLKDGEKFTIPAFSGSFMKVMEEDAGYNAVNSSDSDKYFCFREDAKVVPMSDLVEEFDNLMDHLNGDENNMARKFRNKLVQLKP